MYQLALYFALLFTPVSVDAPTGSIADLQDLCPEARRIAEMPTCLDAESCGAFQQWRQTFGEPGAVPLEPRSARAVRPPGPRWCLAARD